LAFSGIYGVISQKTDLFISTAVKTSDPTYIDFPHIMTTTEHLVNISKSGFHEQEDLSRSQETSENLEHEVRMLRYSANETSRRSLMERMHNY
jgi:hypothetical protein